MSWGLFPFSVRNSLRLVPSGQCAFILFFWGFSFAAHGYSFGNHNAITENPAVVQTETYPPSTTAQPFLNWARIHSIKLTAVEAHHGFADLQPLLRSLANARIIALGEATHGTREFFQLKHRILESVASQNSSVVFSIEASMPEANRLNDYVINGGGDPKRLLMGLHFWTWDTEEVLDMILWMRDFNASGKGRIRFTGFDMQHPTLAMQTVRDFVTVHDENYYTNLNTVYDNVSRTVQAEEEGAFGVATARLPVKAAMGRHLKYSGFIKTDVITEGYAGLWLRVDGPKDNTSLVFDNMSDRGATNTTPWTRYEISVDVPENATNINFGILHSGNGIAWFDSLKLEIDGAKFDDSYMFDLDFESDPPRGFFLGRGKYEITIDRNAAHSGKQSLRSKPMVMDSTSDNDAAIHNAEDVANHLETNRSKFVASGVAARDIDWVIRNARLVLQYMQLKAGTKSRDESMAENVKWIADQNPMATIVLWAHNGHIGYGFRGQSMGSYLKRTFGSTLVNVGFVFDEGSFRAVDGNRLREFTVGPAPGESLDGTLASLKMPIFALDLREAPRKGPVAWWLDKTHTSRNIGAVYRDSDLIPSFVELRPRDTFDVILFVQRTTASHGIQ